MSVLPLVFGYRDPVREMWREVERPLRLFDQYFGMGLANDDMLPLYNGYVLRPRIQGAVARSGVSEVTIEKDKFQVNLDVAHFKPKEIVVKTADGFVVVEGKHEEKADEYGYVYRHFCRRYAIPEGVDPEQITCQLTPDGVLTLGAPRTPKAVANERVVPIQPIEKPSVTPTN